MKGRIAIIGGGFTGLTAAYYLLKHGYSVDLFEKANDLGGLASSFIIHGMPIEVSYHHIFKTDIFLINLAKELNLENKLKWFKSSTAIYYNNHLYSFNTTKDLLRFTPLPFIDRLRAGLVILFLKQLKNWKILTKKKAIDWLYKWAGKNVTEVIWKPLLVGKFGEYYQTISMAWLWSRVYNRSHSRQFRVNELLGYFEGGFKVLAISLEQNIRNLNGNIFVNTQVNKISTTSTNLVKIYVGDRVHIYDKVIVTTPSDVFITLAYDNNANKSVYLSKLQKIKYLGAIIILFSSTQNISNYYWHNINDISLPFLVFINHTQLVPREWYSGKYVYYLGKYVPHDHEYFTMRDDDLALLWFRSLKKIFPNFDQSLIQTIKVFKLKYAQHIVDCSYEEIIPEYNTDIPNVYLANFTQIFPEDRGVNFAIREGINIAKIINY
ncbi:MAG: NAD(P)/FAD-dependent oxidoreductase [Candidatus Dojkabacteria bacterium]|nr:NAD(P)/FAD-dependent oxidoreductase [Candidatus Dojkabacteria bacterium]